MNLKPADDVPVTYLFCMVVPEAAAEDHLQLLANLAELLDTELVRESIERCDNAKCLYQLLCQNPENLAA